MIKILTANPHKRTVPVFFLIGLGIFASGIYFRLYPLLTYVPHDAREKGSLVVINNIRKGIRLAVEKNFPVISEEQKEQLILEKLNATLRGQNAKVRQSIQAAAEQIDRMESFQKHYPYLLASDSFYYYRLTQNIVKQGTISPLIRGSKYFNDMMLAPLGQWEPLNLHPYVGFFVYKLLSLFHPDIPLMQAVAFTPLFVATFALIMFLVICYRLRCHALATLLGGMYFFLSPIYLKRSSWGWYDNDPYNTLFPLLILAIIFYALQNRSDLKRCLVSGIWCSFAFALYALFWHGWMFLLGISVFSGILILLHNRFVLQEREKSRHLFLFYAVLLAGMVIGISIIFGPKEFPVLIREGWKALNAFFTPQVSLWPNLYIGVGELHKASLATVIDLTGNYIFFAAAVAGLIIYSIKIFRQPFDENLYPFCVVAVFFTLSLFLTFGAERFAFLYLTPLALIFTLSMDTLSRSVIKICRSRLSGHWRIFGSSISILIVVALLFWPVKTARQKIPELINIIYNDIWQDALVEIRDRTPPDSIIHTWWSPGHFISAIAQRRVTFDGASINVPQAYWLARAFLSPDERQALGILRMLDDSGNKAAEYLQSEGMPLSEAVGILDSIFPYSAQTARERLRNVLTEQQMDALLKLTHRQAPPAYLLIYNELIEKNIQLSFVGNWDFKKIEAVSQDTKLRREKLLSGIKPYVQFVWEMERGSPRYSGVLKALKHSGATILFENNVSVDVARMQAQINSKTFGRGSPYSMFYLEDGRIVEKKFLNPDLPYSLLLFKRDNDFQCALMDNSLAKSLIMKLYFFEGFGFKYIQPLTRKADLTGRTEIMVFRVDWGKFEKE